MKTWKLSTFDLFSLGMTIKGAWTYRELPDASVLQASLDAVLQPYPQLLQLPRTVIPVSCPSVHDIRLEQSYIFVVSERTHSDSCQLAEFSDFVLGLFHSAWNVNKCKDKT